MYLYLITDSKHMEVKTDFIRKGKTDNPQLEKNFSMSLSVSKRTGTKKNTSKQKNQQDTDDLNNAITQLKPVFSECYRTFYLRTKEYTLFLSALNTFSNVDHILGQNRNLTQ